MAATYLRRGTRAGWVRAGIDLEVFARGLFWLCLPGVVMAMRGEATEDRRASYLDSVLSFVSRGLR